MNDIKPITNKFDSSIKHVEESLDVLSNDIDELRNGKSDELDSLEMRILAIADKIGAKLPKSDKKTLTDTKASVDTYQIDATDVYCRHNKILPNRDVVMTCIAGGISVLLDFMVVKIPKLSIILRDGESIIQKGSPMTALMRRIGFDTNDNTSGWVKCLERFFGVTFDKSVISGEKGLTPKSHRIYSLAHDPSPSGLLWALKDSICGTMSYIDKSGRLKMIPTQKQTPVKTLVTPIIWIGHLISDIFTKAGVPIPNSCLLRTLQFGSFGEKKRTIGQVIEHMYLEGYDLRHLATMTLCNASIELILRIYHALTKDRINPFATPGATILAQKITNERRLQTMRLGAYAIAGCGNITKFAVYSWNPFALNLPIWIELMRTSIKTYQYAHSSEKQVCDLVNSRKKLEDGFEELYHKLELLSTD